MGNNKYWEANVQGVVFTAPTLKKLATKLDIKPSMIEGAYYRKRLEGKIEIKKVETKTQPFSVIRHNPGDFFVRFD